jgi:hypothetical protein
MSNVKIRHIGISLFTGFILLLIGPAPKPLKAQVSGATILGTIIDASGAAVSGAEVDITEVSTDVTQSLTTDVAGFFSAPNLRSGKYDVTITAPGFVTYIERGVTLTVASQQELNITLKIGGKAEKVEVSSTAPVVELASSAISAVVNSTTVRELPLNGRSWTDLASLEPGVSGIQTQNAFNSGSSRGNRGFGAQISISGSRPQQNNYRLDGASINDYANGGPGSVIGGNLGVDAIQEFSVLTSNYSAEYGKTSGGVVNAVTRSGTNQFHGSVYEFLRNNALDARNFFDKEIPPFKRNQFGAAAGGPIRKDRTFIFADYEGIRQSLGVTSVVTVPSAAARAGNLSTGPVTVDPGAQKYLALYPLPNGPLRHGGDIGVLTIPQQQIVSENFLTVRVDHKFSDRTGIFGTYVFDKTPFSTPDNFNDVLLGSLTKRQIAVLEYNHTFTPSFVNSGRVSYNRNFVNNNLAIAALNPAAVDPSLSAVPGQFASQLLISGISTFNGGPGGNPASDFRWNSYQAYDDAFLTRGLHLIKIGFSFEHDQLSSLTLTEASGVFKFGSLPDFLQNKPHSFVAAFPTLSTARHLRQNVFGVYVQDDWHWRPSLTVNLGLRYEMATVPSEVNGKLSNVPSLTSTTPHLGNPYFSNPTLLDFAPRIGFAWDPFRRGKSAVRGGFGIYDSLPLMYEFITLDHRAFPFIEIGSATSLRQGSFPDKAFSFLGPTSSEYGYIEKNPHRNYVMQWNLSVQHEVTPNMSAIIAYVGSHGVHQPFRTDDANIVLPTLTPAGYVWPTPQANGTVLNPNAGAIRMLNWGGSSFYDALQAGVTKRLSHGVQLQGSFTWGKSIDNNSGAVAGDTLSNSISSLSWFDLRLTRARSDFNVGRTLVVSGTWLVPSWKSTLAPVAWLTNGWQLGTILKVADGVPFTPTFGTDGDPLGLNSSDPWDFPNRLSGPGCNTLVNPGNPNDYIKTQCFAVPTAPSADFYAKYCDPSLGVPPQCFNLRGNAGRNILTGPGLLNLDFSIFKNNPVHRISETFNVQFRAEIFNILNHANFAVPVSPDNTDIFDSSGAPTGAAGLLTSTTTTAREVQFAIKIIW